MKVVIDIDEKDFARCVRRGTYLTTASIAERCIANGTPLPKGHGSLISRDAVRKKCIKAQDWGDTNTYINRGLAIAVDFLDCAPVVIPADKEKE